MYDIFGEFDSAEEINAAAEGLFNEGDMDQLRNLGKENGIPEELVEAYINGEIPFLADACIAACGKLDVELPEAVEKYGKTAECLADYIKARSEEETFARQVRRKGKQLMDVLKYMEDEARKSVKKRSGMQVACNSAVRGLSNGERLLSEGGQKMREKELRALPVLMATENS